jgi:hypothetical protein
MTAIKNVTTAAVKHTRISEPEGLQKAVEGNVSTVKKTANVNPRALSGSGTGLYGHVGIWPEIKIPIPLKIAGRPKIRQSSFPPVRGSKQYRSTNQKRNDVARPAEAPRLTSHQSHRSTHHQYECYETQQQVGD